jgi:hypothetical protein
MANTITIHRVIISVPERGGTAMNVARSAMVIVEGSGRISGYNAGIF